MPNAPAERYKQTALTWIARALGIGSVWMIAIELTFPPPNALTVNRWMGRPWRNYRRGSIPVSALAVAAGNALCEAVHASEPSLAGNAESPSKRVGWDEGPGSIPFVPAPAGLAAWAIGFSVQEVRRPLRRRGDVHGSREIPFVERIAVVGGQMPGPF